MFALRFEVISFELSSVFVLTSEVNVFKLSSVFALRFEVISFGLSSVFVLTSEVNVFELSSIFALTSEVNTFELSFVFTLTSEAKAFKFLSVLVSNVFSFTDFSSILFDNILSFCKSVFTFFSSAKFVLLVYCILFGVSFFTSLIKLLSDLSLFLISGVNKLFIVLSAIFVFELLLFSSITLEV